MYGYAGKIIDINLTKQEMKIKELDTKEAKEYLGGSGYTAKIIYEEVPKGADPLGPENILCFAVGVLAGTNIPTACRVEASAKSPATGLFGTANSGNFWGSELKFAGYDGIIIRGKAENPVYININNDRIEILDATEMTDKDAWEKIEIIREKYNDKEIQIATIGQAGENLCRFASIENGPYDAWGRTGLGAVMGSKNLKAISVRGSKGIKVFNKKEFIKETDKVREQLYNSPFYGPFSKFGTMLATVPYQKFGALPGRNFQTGVIEDWTDTRSRKVVHKYSNRGVACISCPIACAHWVEVKEGEYKGLKIKDMEVSPVIGFGAGCDIKDMAAIAKITEFCQRYGIDLLSAGSVVAFAMELYQREIITEKDLGFKLQWGDEKATFRLLEMIATREGFGDYLADGVKIASERIQNSEYYAMHIKGLEIPMADARGRWSTWTFGNITNIRGGDHLRSRNPVENLKYNDNPKKYETEKFDLGEKVFNELDMFEEVKKEVFEENTKDVRIAKMTKWSEDLISVYNSVGLCIRPPVLQSIGPTSIAKLYTTLTGIEITPQEIMAAGEKAWNLKKLFNIREGEKPEDSKYPRRFYKEKLSQKGKEKDSLEDEKVMETLEEYYLMRGWDRTTGIPTAEKLETLNIKPLTDNSN